MSNTVSWRDYFTYEGGLLYWKVSPPNCRIKAGDLAGCLGNRGYNRVTFNGVEYMSHRVIYELHFGPMPEGYQIDHVDGNKSNNNLENLRLANRTQNSYNRGKNKNNSSGYKGVHFCSRDKRYKAQIALGKKREHLGSFKSAEEAYEAYLKAAKETHKNFLWRGLIE